MPNHCENDLIVSGPKAEIERFIAAAVDPEDGDNAIRLDNFVPLPPELLNYEDEYNWRIEHWGTKWDCYDFSYAKWSPKGRSWSTSFLTAWTPPDAAFIAIAKLFPKLTFNLRYYEGGCCYKGQLKVKGETIIAQWDGDYYGWRGG